MHKNIQELNDTKEILLTLDILLALLSHTVALVGIAVALVGIINFKPVLTGISRFADYLFIFSGLGFVLVGSLMYFALRRLHSSQLMLLSKFIDIVFLAALIMLVLAVFLTVYSFVLAH